MTPDQAKLIANYTLADYETEIPATKRVIAAVPAGRKAYAPSEKCMTALALAWHVASAEVFFLNGVIDGEFKGGESAMPDNIKSAADVLAWYDANQPATLEKAKALSGDALAKTVDFFGVWQAPAVTFLTLMVKHGSHHRGQLSAYLRPMGAKVPSIYGPSADTPIENK